jgi:hypothetical protein
MKRTLKDVGRIYDSFPSNSTLSVVRIAGVLN